MEFLLHHIDAGGSYGQPCVIGIVLATGSYMILNNVFERSSSTIFDARAFILTVFLAIILFDSKALIKTLIKKKASPITLIAISAVFGIIAYGL